MFPNKPEVFAPKPVPEEVPKPVVVLFDVPNNPPVDVEVDCEPKRLPVGLLPNKPPLPSPLVCVLPNGVDDELAAPKGLALVVPKPVLVFVPKPPKLLAPNAPVPPLPLPNLRPAA